MWAWEEPPRQAEIDETPDGEYCAATGSGQICRTLRSLKAELILWVGRRRHRVPGTAFRLRKGRERRS